MRNIEIIKYDVYTKPFEYIWWKYNFEELMSFVKTVGLEVDERIISTQSNKMLARFIKDSITSKVDEMVCSKMISAFGIERLVILDEDDYQDYKEMFREKAVKELCFIEKQ